MIIIAFVRCNIKSETSSVWISYCKWCAVKSSNAQIVEICTWSVNAVLVHAGVSHNNVDTCTGIAMHYNAV